jgi:ssDNA thymidine ADP-ribosyltransferase, DarT
LSERTEVEQPLLAQLASPKRTPYLQAGRKLCRRPSNTEHEFALARLRERWGSVVVTRAVAHELAGLPMLVAARGDALVGCLTYRQEEQSKAGEGEAGFWHSASVVSVLAEQRALIDWGILQARDFKRDLDDPKKLDRYQAEVLFHRYLPVQALLGIVCYTETLKANLQARIETAGAALPVHARKGWYF